MRNRKLLLLFGANLIAACHGDRSASESALPTQTIRTAKVQLDVRPMSEEIVGTVRARHSATIASTVSGTVREVRFSVGSRVRSGDVLVRLSAPEIDAKVAQAHAVLEHAKLEHERAEKLQRVSAIPSAQFDTAMAQLRIAEASQAEADSMANHMVLRAPFSGVVTSKFVSVGDTLMPGQPALLVEEPSALRFEAAVSEAASHRLRQAQSLDVRLDGFDHSIAARIAEISPNSDAASRTVLVKLDLPSLPQVHTGLFGRLLLPSSGERSLAVPADAILRRGQLEEVFVVEAGVARLRLIKTGRQREGVVDVLSGVSEGDEVALSHVFELRDGQPVRSTL